MKDGHCLAVCESIHDVISLEQQMKAQSLWCSMVPTPRAVSSDCGMSLEYEIESHQTVLGIAGEHRIHLEQSYRFTGGELIPID